MQSVLDGIKIDKGFEWVSSHCMELLRAKLSGQLDQDGFDYEIAKLTLEFIAEYEKKPLPGKPISMRSFEEMPKGMLDNMRRQDAENVVNQYNEQKSRYAKVCQEISDQNTRNVIWLEHVLEILKKTNHERVSDVQGVLSTHD